MSQPEIDTRVPDVIGELIGWRAWHLEGSYDDPVLASVSHHAIWPSGEWMIARCHGHLSSDKHPIPVETCSCGIYAASDRPHLVSLSYNGYGEDRTTVIGEVGLAGKVIPGTQGFRAEKARVVRLFVPYERWKWVAGLARTYGVPVELSNTFKAA